MNFADLGLSDELLQAVETAGYSEPTPIQAQAIPPVLMMKDLILLRFFKWQSEEVEEYFLTQGSQLSVFEYSRSTLKLCERAVK